MGIMSVAFADQAEKAGRGQNRYSINMITRLKLTPKHQDDM